MSRQAIPVDCICVDDRGTTVFLQSVISRLGEYDLSLEEARWRHYCNTGRVSLPKTDAPIPASAFSDSSKSAHDTDARRADSASLCSPSAVDGELATSSAVCSLCAARLAADERVRRGENDDDDSKVSVADDGSDSEDGSATSSDSHRLHRGFDNEQGNDEVGKAVAADAADTLSTELAGMGLSRNTRAGVGTLASLRPDTGSYSREDNNVATGNDKSLFTSKDRSPISALLSTIFKFIASSDVYPFLKQAETLGGLRNTCAQMFELPWMLDNFFNIHGGILIYCLRKSLTTMSDISQSLGSNVWTRDPVLIRKLDDTYRKELHPHIQTDGDYNTGASAAWKSYCLELAVVFSEQFPKWQSARYFRDLSNNYKGCFNPMITTSYIEDLTVVWTKVHPALLEVTRWFEPFIDYGADSNRKTPFYDATIALGYRVRELLSRRDAKEPEVSQRADSLLEFLREHRSQGLARMQAEMELHLGTVSRDFEAPGDGELDKTLTESDPPSLVEAVVVERADQVTGWQRAERGPPRVWRALALHEVRVMKSYRPGLLCARTDAAGIRTGIFQVLSQTEGLDHGAPLSEEDVFWDRIYSLVRSSVRK